ncbi:MAG: hypothetical protein RSD54_04405, partial [Ruthenibacterium sp.]
MSGDAVCHGDIFIYTPKRRKTLTKTSQNAENAKKRKKLKKTFKNPCHVQGFLVLLLGDCETPVFSVENAG